MNVETERRLLGVIERALELEPGERQGYLETTCGDDAELLEEARAALTDEAGGLDVFLAEPAWAEVVRIGSEDGTSSAGGSDPETPTVGIPAFQDAVGPYRLLGKLGEGGMGRVYLAEQEKPLRRRVALKLMHASLVGRDARARFDAERQALARLSHPNVGAIFDAGTTGDGVPFFAMELVEGEPVTHFCDGRRLGLEPRLKLMIAACRGVEHAHRKQVIHRDLKPSNIQVLEVDGEPVPKIIDFGVAKALDHPLTDTTLATGGGMLGTPTHMSPEALTGSDDLDTRADVYSLGVILYKLLAGVLPFDAGNGTLSQLLRRIRDEDAPRPSARLASLGAARREEIATRRGLSPQELHRRLQSELDWIVLRAIARRREERYGSATELAADLERYLRHEPVEARPPSLGYTAGRWIRRHRAPVAAGALLVASLVAGLVARGIEADRANRAAAVAEQVAVQAEAALEEAEAARAEAEETVQLLLDLFEQANPNVNQGRQITALEVVEKALDVLPESFPDRPLSRARFTDQLSNVFIQLGRLETGRELAQAALELRERNLPEGHPDVARSLGQVGYAHERQGQLAIAEELYHRALEMGERALPLGDDWLAKIAGNLAILKSRAGRYAEAEPFYHRTLAIREQNLGRDHPSIGFPAVNLGMNYALQGKLDEAEDLLRRAYEVFLAGYTIDSPFTLSAMAGLARVQADRGDLEAGARDTRGVLARMEKLLGPEHPMVAEVVHQLATILREARSGDAEAVALYRRAIAIREATQGPDSADLAKSLVGLARARRDQGRVAEAAKLLQRAARVYGRMLPAGHPDRKEAEAELEVLETDGTTR